MIPILYKRDFFGWKGLSEQSKIGNDEWKAIKLQTRTQGYLESGNFIQRTSDEQELIKKLMQADKKQGNL